MKEDNEMLNSALDAAMLEVDNASKSEAPEADPKDAPVVDDAPGTETPAEAPQTDLEPDSSGTAEPEAEAPPLAAEPALAAPVHWSPERAEKFKTFPREAQELILQREQELDRKLHEVASKRGNGQLEARFYADFDTPEAANLHRAKMQAQGISDPVAELHRYRAWERVLEADPHTAISKLMSQNGFNPYDFINEGANQRENQYQDPRVDDAIQRAEAAEAKIKAWEEKQEQARIGGLVNSYKAGNFDDGTPRAKFMSLYAAQITQAYQAISQNPQYSHLSEQDWLHYATEFTRSQVNEFHGSKAPAKVEAPKKTREQIIEESKKAQAAVIPTSGAPNTGSLATKNPRIKGKNFSEKAGKIADLAIERHWNPAH